MRPRDGEGGFTLVELLVVVVIPGILAAVVVFAVRGTTERGTEAAVATDERILRTAMETYCAQKSTYPVDPPDDPATPGHPDVVDVLITEKFLASRSGNYSLETGTKGSAYPEGSCAGLGYKLVGPIVEPEPPEDPCGALGAGPTPGGILALDPSFGVNGMLTTDFGSTSDSANALVIDADDKIVAVGGGGSFNLARYDACGGLDTTYDTDGKQTTLFPDVDGRTFSNESARAVANAPGGKIVVAGGVSVVEADGRTHTDIAVARYTAAGGLDTTFSDDGMVTTDIGITDPLLGTTIPSDEGAAGVAIDRDGRIVVAGTSAGLFAVVRYTPDGDLDTRFDDDGKVTTDMQVTPSPGPGYSLPSFANAVVIDGNGRILVAGQSSPNPGPVNVAGSDFTFARYNADGTLDLTFGAGGKVYWDLGYQDGATALALQPDGKIVAAGYVVRTMQIFSYLAVVRLEPNGSRDALFGNQGGGVFTGDARIAHGVAVQADGRIVAAGAAETGSGNGSEFTVMRLDGDGHAIGADSVTSPSRPGQIFTDFGGSDTARGVAIYPTSSNMAGRIVAAGSGSPNRDFALARYLAQ